MMCILIFLGKMAEEKDSNEKDDHLHVLFKKLKVNANWYAICFMSYYFITKI